MIPNLSSTPKIHHHHYYILTAGSWWRGDTFNSTPAPHLGTGGRGGGQHVLLAYCAGVPAPGGCEFGGLLRIL